MAKARCTCNWGWLIVALILFAVGLYGIIGGISMQWAAAGTSGGATILGWYFAGFLAMALGKMAKWRAHGICSTHK